MNSALPRISQPVSSLTPCRRMSGVLPTAPTKPRDRAHATVPATAGLASAVSASLLASAATAPTISSAGGSTSCACGERCDVGQRAAQQPLLGKRGALDDGDRMIGLRPGGAQPRDDARQLGDAHVEDDRVLRVGKEAPVGRRAAVVVTGHEGDALRQAAVGEGQSRARRRAERRGDAGHHGVGDAVRLQDLEFLAAAAEHERVTALQARHALAARRRARRAARGCAPAGRAHRTPCRRRCGARRGARARAPPRSPGGHRG